MTAAGENRIVIYGPKPDDSAIEDSHWFAALGAAMISQLCT
jgi:hypothetical protein